MKFTVKFKTLGMTLVAGEAEADRVENAKPKATDLIERRNMADKNFSARIKKWFIKAYGPMPTVSHVSHNSGDPVGHRGHTFNQRRQSMITHVLTNGDAILEIEVSDNKDTMTAVFKRSDPDIYDEAEFAVTRNPNYPFELLRDIIDQCGFMDQPYFHADGWKLN